MTDQRLTQLIALLDFFLALAIGLVVLLVSGPFDNTVQRFLIISIPTGLVVSWRGTRQAKRFIARGQPATGWLRLSLELFSVFYFMTFSLMILQAAQVALGYRTPLPAHSVADTAAQWGLSAWLRYLIMAAAFSLFPALLGLALGFPTSWLNSSFFRWAHKKGG